MKASTQHNLLSSLLWGVLFTFLLIFILFSHRLYRRWEQICPKGLASCVGDEAAYLIDEVRK